MDDVGYYQQKKTDSNKGESNYGEKNYLLVDGQPLDFIPVSFACDEEIKGGKLPRELGFLSPIVDKALTRYVVSADYSEALSTLKATLHVMGVSLQGWEDYKEINGVDYVQSGPGAVNIWADPETQIQLIEPQASLVQFKEKLEINTQEAKAAGAVFKTEASTQRTATEIIEEASSAAAVLKPIADNVESAIKWQIAYCAMFDGKVKQDKINDYVKEIEWYLIMEEITWH